MDIDLYYFFAAEFSLSFPFTSSFVNTTTIILLSINSTVLFLRYISQMNIVLKLSISNYNSKQQLPSCSFILLIFFLSFILSHP